MHNLKVEMQGKCRRLFYDKATGEALNVASGGGALLELTGDDLIIATYNDMTAPQRIGCIEEFYNPIPASKPLSVDLAKVGACHDAVTAHRVAKKDEADFVFDEGIKQFGIEIKSTEALRHALKVKEKLTKDKPEKDKEHTDTRFLHVLIDFEDKIINHTVLAIIVQPKHFHLDLGPIHIDIGKTTATFISLISLAWVVISVIYSLISIDLSSTLFNVVGGFAPSLISILFVVIFFYTLIKGVYPLKRMWSNTLNFDKTSPISK